MNTIIDKTNLKKSFETGDVPTQSDFFSLIDYCFNEISITSLPEFTNSVNKILKSNGVSAEWADSGTENIYIESTSLPVSGTPNVLYILTDTNEIYFWYNNQYQKITIELGETSTTAFRGDHGLVAYNHAITGTHLELGTTSDTAFRGDHGLVAYNHATTGSHLQLGDTSNTAFRGDHGLVAYNNAVTGLKVEDVVTSFNTAKGDIVTTPASLGCVSLKAFEDTKTFTGFIENETISVYYDYDTRTITLTGDLRYYFNGTEKTLGTTWTSDPHDDETGSWYLYSSDGTNFVWSLSRWTFADMQVSVVHKNSIPEHTFCLREVHGVLDPDAHELIHRIIGTINMGGGKPVNGTYIEQGTLNSDNCLHFDSAVLEDEDCETNVNGLFEAKYTLTYLNSTGDNTFEKDSVLPYTISTSGSNYIQWNNLLTGEMIEGRDNKFYNVHQLIVPVGSDTNSQSFRMVFIQPQVEHNSITSALHENPRSLNIGNDLYPFEGCLYTRITYHTNSALTTSGKCNIADKGISYIVGSRMVPIIETNFDFSDHAVLSDLNWLDSGHTGTVDTIPAFNHLGVAIELSKSGSSNTVVMSNSSILSLKADLQDGKVPSSQLPGDVLTYFEVSGMDGLPISGDLYVVYYVTSTNETYRWSGTDYRLSASTLTIGETASEAYRGDRGKIAYDHSQTTTGNPHDVSYSDVGAAPSNQGVTNGNSHDHNGGDGGQIDHTGLSNKGTNSHVTIDNHLSNTSNPHSTTKAQVGLTNVDDTSDLNKPLSIAVTGALCHKVDKTITVNSYPLSANVSLTKSDIGLSNVDNTTDLDKPISTVVSGALTDGLALKVDKTITVNSYPLSANISLTKSDVGLTNVDNSTDLNKPLSIAVTGALETKVDKTLTVNSYPLSANISLNKTDIGLTNVDNTTDLNKPLSIAVTGALHTKVDNTITINTYPLSANISITKTDVGLSSVDNTSDLNKPLSNAVTGALALKVDKTLTINTYPLSANISITKSDVGLNNVTDNAQYYSGGQVIPVTDGGLGVGTITGIIKGFGTSSVSAATPLVDYDLPALYARVLTSNATTTQQTLQNITGLSVSLAANSVYEISASLSIRSSSNAGNNYGIAYSGTGVVEATVIGGLSNTTIRNERYPTFGASTGVFATTGNTDMMVNIKGIITTTNAGTLTLQHLKVTSGTSTVYVNSYLKATKI